MISEKEYRYYQRLHQNRLNLVIHVIGSIMFIAGNILILIGLLNFIDFIQIMPELFNIFSPHILITHSFGAVPATYSLSLDKRLQIEKFIMFAPPNKFSDRVDDVIEIAGISKKVKKPLIKKVETEFSLPFKTLNISNFIKQVNWELR